MNGTELNRTADVGIIRKLYRDGLLSDEALIAASAVLRPISSWFSWANPESILRHSPEWSYHQFQTAGLPYVYNFQFSEIESFNRNPNYPDVFSEEFAEWADYLARSICVDMADESLLLGYADVPEPAITANRPGSWAEGLDLEKVEDRAKLEKIIRQYFKVTAEAIRRYDRNHLIFGPRFDRPSGTPDWIIEIAGEYFDVLLCMFPPGEQHQQHL